MLIVCILDRYLWRLGKELVGKEATRIAFLFYLTNKAFNEIILRCFANGIEAVLNVVAFYYFLKCKDSFNASYAKMTALLIINFMIRNTSAIFWVPLFLIKIIKDRAFPPLLISLVLVALPVLCICIFLDTAFYGFKEIVVTPYNFLYYNVILGYSSHYGIDPPYEYLTSIFPICFTILVPFLVLAYY